MTPLEHALELAERGIPVFPCRPNKAPLTDHGHKDATTDPERISALWNRHPDALVGVPTGEASGLLVVDVDPQGADWHREHANEAAAGRTNRTKRGHHLVYKMPPEDIRNSASKLAPGVDIRANGGYVIWWPAHGLEAVGDLEDIGPPPGWLLEKLRKPTSPPEKAQEPPPGRICAGARNDFLSREAYRLRKQGATIDQIDQILTAYNIARCTPQLSAQEVRAIAEGKRDIQPEEEDQRALEWPPAMDLAALAMQAPAPIESIIEDWLPCGYATLFAGHGGVSKSTNALHLAAASGLGEDFFGMKVAQRRVLYLSCEDRENVLHLRLARICEYRGWNLADLADRLDILDLVGHDTLLMTSSPFGLILTEAFHLLRERIQATGAELLIVDGVSDTYGGNENSRAEVKRFVNALLSLVPADRGAVLLIAHVSKPAAAQAGGSEGYSGSTGWHNSVRARWYLYPETERTDEGATEATGKLRLELKKSNLGRADQAVVLQWDDDAKLFTGHLESSSEFDRRAQEQEEREGILAAIEEVAATGDYVPAAAQGPRTAHHVLSATESLPDTLRGKAARRRFWRHVEHLRRIGEIRESSIRRSNRHLVATLTTKAAQGKACADAPNSNIENMTHSGAGAPCADAPHSAGGYRGSARAHNAYQQAKYGE